MITKAENSTRDDVDEGPPFFERPKSKSRHIVHGKERTSRLLRMDVLNAMQADAIGLELVYGGTTSEPLTTQANLKASDEVYPPPLTMGRLLCFANSPARLFVCAT